MDIGPIVATLHLPDPTVSSPRRPGETISHPIALGPAPTDAPSLRDRPDATSSRPDPVPLERTERPAR